MPGLDEQIAYEQLDAYASPFDATDPFDALEDSDYVSGDLEDEEEVEAQQLLDELSGDEDWQGGEEEADVALLLDELAGDDVEIAGFFSSLGKIAKSVVKSPITKAVVAGASFVVPAVGIPAGAALMAADKVVSSLDSKSPRRKRAARRLVRSTHRAARAGSSQARRGLRVLQVAKRVRNKRRRTVRKQLRSRRRLDGGSATRLRSQMKALQRKVKDYRRRLTRAAKASKSSASNLQKVPGVMVMRTGAVVRGDWYRKRG